MSRENEKRKIEEKENKLKNEKKRIEEIEKRLEEEEKRKIEEKENKLKNEEKKKIEEKEKKLEEKKKMIEEKEKRLEEEENEWANGKLKGAFSEILKARRRDLGIDKQYLENERQRLDNRRQILANDKQILENRRHSLNEKSKSLKEERQRLRENETKLEEQKKHFIQLYATKAVKSQAECKETLQAIYDNQGCRFQLTMNMNRHYANWGFSDETLERDAAWKFFVGYLSLFTDSGNTLDPRTPFAAMLSSSGGGKTHLLDYFSDKLLEQKEYIPIRVSFNGNSDFKLRQGVKDAYKKRIIWDFFYPTHRFLDVPKFDNLSLTEVFKMIEKFSERSPLLLIDEIVKFHNNTKENEQARDDENSSLKESIDLLRIPTLWTTFDATLYQLAPRSNSDRKIIWLNITPITMHSLQQKTRLFTNYENIPDVRAIIRLCGGHPRTIEILSRHIQYFTRPQNGAANLKRPIVFSDLFNSIIALGYQPIRLPFTEGEYLELMYNAVFEHRVYLECSISSQPNSNTWLEAISYSLLLNSYNEDSQHLQVNIMALYRGIMRLDKEQDRNSSKFITLMKMLLFNFTGNPSDPELFSVSELFHLYYEVLRQHILYEKGVRTITLKEYYANSSTEAIFSDPNVSFQITPFAASATEVRKMKEPQSEEDYELFFKCPPGQSGKDTFYYRKSSSIF